MTSSSDPAAVGGVGIGAVPKQRRGIEVRDRLLAAAIEEFKQNGLEGSRVEHIVEAAGTSWGTFFRYFPRKEDVYLVESARQFKEYVRPAFDEGLADDSIPIEQVARNVFDRMMEPRISPRFHAEMINEAVSNPLRFAAIIGEGELPVAALITQLLATGQKRGEVRDDIPAHVCAMVLTAGVIFSTSQVLRAVADGHLPGEEIAKVAHQAFDLTWAGLQPE